MSDRLKKLTEIPLGKEVILVDFTNQANRNQLMEMGCIPGMRIKREYNAPFGDPICISVGGYFLMLRKKEAEQIVVKSE